MKREEVLQALRKNRQETARYSVFGDDNHAALDAMIRAVSQEWDEDDVYEHYPVENYPNQNDAALSIIQALPDILEGKEDLEDYLYPV